MTRKSLFLAVVALGCGGGSGSGNSFGNHPPAITAAAAASAVAIGRTIPVSATATDPDANPLTYSWVQTSPASPQGSFSSQSTAAPTWTAPTVAALTPFTLAVTVSDGQGGTATASVRVYVKTSTETSFTAEVVPILEACVSCHRSNFLAADLSLEGNSSYAELVNVPAKVGCVPQLRVKPGDPDASVLFLKMIGTTCGQRMPPTNPTYFDNLPAAVANVRTWIEQGAQDN
jgi:Bacterial Ig domain